MRFADPRFFLLLWALPVFAALFWVGARRRRRAIEALGHMPTLRRMAAGVSAPKRITRQALLLVAWTLATFALARPQFGLRSELRPTKGIDLVVALDVSRSMLAQDIQPNRLIKAKVELRSLLERLKGDRVGIVAFAGTAFTQCPLTSDYAAAQMFLDAIGPDTIPVPGTDLGAAIDLGVRVLTEGGNASRVLILLTDGEDNEGRGLAAAKAAAEKGVRIYAVGVGAPAGEPIPLLDEEGHPKGYQKDAAGQIVLSRLDEDDLRQIARATNGKYFPSVGSEIGIDRVYDEVAGLEKKEFDARVVTVYDERFPYALFPAFALLCAEFLLGDAKGWRGRRPGREAA